MRPTFVLATPLSVATIGARSSDMPSRSAAWDITRSKMFRSEAASLLSDAIAEISGGSMVSTNGIPTIRNAAAVSLSPNPPKEGLGDSP